ncbi:hypothetical protein OC846_005127 [Tilletia horrida]|uniref:SET domain-containing protein n=1 Tax=Tilletia horrida TaxID=155126 RepID=A0AAN6JQ74_9BASI|nr:hypothetical protein OC846_005127 [Tilletia horrida]
MSSSEDSRTGNAFALKLVNGSAASSKKGDTNASSSRQSNGNRAGAATPSGADSSRSSQTRATYAGNPPASPAATVGARAARASGRQSSSRRGTAGRNRIQPVQPSDEAEALQVALNDNQVGDLSSVRLHPGVVQSTWHTSTDSKTEFDVGEPDEDPNIITTRVTTVTTTTTVTTFTSPRSAGDLNFAGPSLPVVAASTLSILPNIPAVADNNPQNSTPPPETVNGTASRRANGSRPRVSFALEAGEDGDDDDRDGYDGGDDEGEGDEYQEEEEEEEEEIDELAGDDDRMSTDEVSQSPDSATSRQRRRRDRDDDDGAGAGSARGAAPSTRSGAGARASTGADTTASGNRSGGAVTRRSGRSSGGTSRAAAPSSSAPTSPQGGLTTRRRSNEQDVQDPHTYSPVLAARVTTRGKDLSSASLTGGSPSAGTGVSTRRSLGNPAPAGASSDDGLGRARPRRASTATTGMTSSQQPSQPESLQRTTRNSVGRASGSSSTPTLAHAEAGVTPPVMTRHSARLQGDSGGPAEVMSTHSSATTLVDGLGKGGSDDQSKEVEAGATSKVISWRDKVFLTSGIYSDDFREGKGRKRKRKRAILERRRAGGEGKRARTQSSRARTEGTARSIDNADGAGSDGSDSDASMSSLSSISEESEDDQFLPEHSALPLPDHYGFFLLVQDRDFRLTYNILQEADEMRARADAKKKPRPYQQITTNRYVTRPKLAGEVPVCQCIPPPESEAPETTASNSGGADRDSNDEVVQIVRRGCGDDCINRQLQYVCDPRKCPCGEQCSNLSLGKRPFPKLEVFNYGQRGFGLRTPIALHKDQFLGEYRGEVIDLIEAARRTKEIYMKEGNYYFLDYDAQAGEVLDAGMKGSLIRFANHSCSPNCYVMKWTICGTDEQLTAEFQIGMYALRDIEAGEELTYDYGWSEFRSKVVSAEVTATIKCLCGASNCVGTLGGKKSSPAELSKTGLGQAANQKKEKALRQQRKSASAAANGGSNIAGASGHNVSTPTPDGTEDATPEVAIVASADSSPTNDVAITSAPATNELTSISVLAGNNAVTSVAAESGATVSRASNVAAASSTNVAPNNDPPQTDSTPPNSRQMSTVMIPRNSAVPNSQSSSKTRTTVIIIPGVDSAAPSASALAADKGPDSADPGSTASLTRAAALPTSPVVEITVPLRSRPSALTDPRSGPNAPQGSSPP